MEITLETIKILRDKTGAGMVDCKNALTEASGEIEKAIEILRKKGIAKAAKRGEREASEGIIKVAHNEAGTEGYILEVNAETDFVVLSEKFQNYVNQAFTLLGEKKTNSLDEFMALPMDGVTVKESLENLSGVIGEKLGIKGLAYLTSNGTIYGYSHMGGRIGVLVELDQPGKAELAREIAMQVAAASPKYINPEDVKAEELEKEKEIYKEQLLKEGKPEAMIDKIMGGKVSKYYEEVCLTKQEFIKDDKKKVQDLLGDVKVVNFIRYSL